eukprot:1419314-Prymnesium_polylepis.1
MGCPYFWWGCVELCFVSADERSRTVCGFALLVWLVWLSWLGPAYGLVSLAWLVLLLFLFWLGGCVPSPPTNQLSSWVWLFAPRARRSTDHSDTEHIAQRPTSVSVESTRFHRLFHPIPQTRNSQHA